MWVTLVLWQVHFKQGIFFNFTDNRKDWRHWGWPRVGRACSNQWLPSATEWSWLIAEKLRFQPNSHKEVNSSNNYGVWNRPQMKFPALPSENPNRRIYSCCVHSSNPLEQWHKFLCYLVCMCVYTVYIHVIQAHECLMCMPMHEEARGGYQLLSSVTVLLKIECVTKMNCKVTFSAGLTEPGSPGTWLSLSLPPLCWHYRHAQIVGIGDLNLCPHVCTPLSQLPSLHQVFF